MDPEFYITHYNDNIKLKGCKGKMAQKGKFAAPFKTPPAKKITSFFSQQSTPGVDVSSITGISESENSPNVDKSDEIDAQPSCSHQDERKSTAKRIFTFKTPVPRSAESKEDVEYKAKSTLVVKWPTAWPHVTKNKATAKNPPKNAKVSLKPQEKSDKNIKVPGKKAKLAPQNGCQKQNVQKQNVQKQNVQKQKGQKDKETKKAEEQNVQEKAGPPAKKVAKRKANEQDLAKPKKKLIKRQDKKQDKKQENQEAKQPEPSKKKKTVGKSNAITDGGADMDKPQMDVADKRLDQDVNLTEGQILEEPSIQVSNILEVETPIFPVASQLPGSPGIPSYQVPKTSTPKKPTTPRTPRTPFHQRMAAKSPKATLLKKSAQKEKKASSEKKVKSKSKALKKSINKTFPQCSQGVFEFTMSPPSLEKKAGGSKKRNKKGQKLAEQEVKSVILKMKSEMMIYRQRRLRLLMELFHGATEVGGISMIQPLNA